MEPGNVMQACLRSTFLNLHPCLFCALWSRVYIRLMQLMLLLLKDLVTARVEEMQCCKIQWEKIHLVVNSIIDLLQWPHRSHCGGIIDPVHWRTDLFESCTHTAEKVLLCWLHGVWSQKLDHLDFVIIVHLEIDILGEAVSQLLQLKIITQRLY